MCIADKRSPELIALVEALTRRKSVFQLKARLLKGVRSELQVARESGLTWRVIWGTLREEGYPGGYQQFCKAANRALEVACASTGSNENLPSPTAEIRTRKQTVIAGSVNGENTGKKEKPAWQVQREEEMARLDREAELNRQRASRLQPAKVFQPSAFVGRSED